MATQVGLRVSEHSRNRATIDDDNALLVLPDALTADLLVTVGPGGDYATINEALAYLSTFRAGYRIDPLQGLTAEMRLLAGYTMQEQVFVRRIDLGWITMTSEASPVPIQRSALTASPQLSAGLTNSRFPAFAAVERATLPVIACLFHMDDSGEAHGRVGVQLLQHSAAIVGKDCGVRNAGERGVIVTLQSSLTGIGSIWSGAGRIGARVANCSFALLSHSNCDDCGRSGVLGVGIDAGSGSIVSADFAKARNCLTYGIIAEGTAIISAIGADATGAGTYGLAIANWTSGAEFGTACGILNATSAKGTLSALPNILHGAGTIFAKPVDRKGRGMDGLIFWDRPDPFNLSEANIGYRLRFGEAATGTVMLPSADDVPRGAWFEVSNAGRESVLDVKINPNDIGIIVFGGPNSGSLTRAVQLSPGGYGRFSALGPEQINHWDGLCNDQVKATDIVPQ